MDSVLVLVDTLPQMLGEWLMSLAELKAGSVHCLLLAHLSFSLNYILVWDIEYSFVKELTEVLLVCCSLLLGLSYAHTLKGLSQKPMEMEIGMHKQEKVY